MTVVREQGKVVRVEKGRAAVEIAHAPGPECRGCTACKPAGNRRFLLWVDADGLTVGQHVAVEVPVPSAWRAILLVFALPLAALVGGMVVGGAWEGLQQSLGLGAEGTALLCGAGLAGIAFAGALLEERRGRDRLKPRVLDG